VLKNYAGAKEKFVEYAVVDEVDICMLNKHRTGQCERRHSLNILLRNKKLKPKENIETYRYKACQYIHDFHFSCFL
jgi:hypothetical protein